MPAAPGSAAATRQHLTPALASTAASPPGGTAKNGESPAECSPADGGFGWHPRYGGQAFEQQADRPERGTKRYPVELAVHLLRRCASDPGRSASRDATASSRQRDCSEDGAARGAREPGVPPPAEPPPDPPGWHALRRSAYSAAAEAAGGHTQPLSAAVRPGSGMQIEDGIGERAIGRDSVLEDHRRLFEHLLGGEGTGTATDRPRRGIVSIPAVDPAGSSA